MTITPTKTEPSIDVKLSPKRKLADNEDTEASSLQAISSTLEISSDEAENRLKKAKLNEKDSDDSFDMTQPLKSHQFENDGKKKEEGGVKAEKEEHTDDNDKERNEEMESDDDKSKEHNEENESEKEGKDHSDDEGVKDDSENNDNEEVYDPKSLNDESAAVQLDVSEDNNGEYDVKSMDVEKSNPKVDVSEDNNGEYDVKSMDVEKSNPKVDVSEDNNGEYDVKSMDVEKSNPIVMKLDEFINWNSLVLYGARPRNDVKVNTMVGKITSEDGTTIDRVELRKLFTDSPPTILITEQSLQENFHNNSEMGIWNVKKNMGIANAPAMLFEANHRLSAVRAMEKLREEKHAPFLKTLSICIRVYVVPNADEAEFNASLSKSMNKSGHRAHWSNIQFRVAALLERALEKRAVSESSSFLDKMETCRALREEFPDGLTKYSTFKAAREAKLIDKSSSMEAAFLCSCFDVQLRDEIVRLFSHKNLANTVLYRESPPIIQRVFNMEPNLLNEFIEDLMNGGIISSEKLRSDITDKLKDKAPLVRSATKNAQRKSLDYAKKKDVMWSDKLTIGMNSVKSIDEIEIKKDGCTELEKLRSVVSGAVDSQSKTQKWIKGHNLYAALFKTQADVNMRASWVECFVRFGGIVILTDLKPCVNHSVLGTATMKAVPLFAMQSSKKPPLVCGVYANGDVFNIIEPESIASPKNIKSILENLGFDTHDIMLVHRVMNRDLSRQPTASGIMAMVVWRRLRSEDNASPSNTHAAELDSASLELVQSLVDKCNTRLGNSNLIPIRIVIESIESLQKWNDIVASAEIVNCKLSGPTVLRTHSRHGRYIIDENKDTMIKCPFGNAIKATALMTLVSGSNDRFYELAISKARIVAMVKPAITVIKKTKVDGAEPLCWPIDVNLSLHPIDDIGPDDQEYEQNHQQQQIVLSLANSNVMVDYNVFMPEVLAGVHWRQCASLLATDGDDGSSSGSRRTWSQAFETESKNAIVLERRMNTGGRKKKKHSDGSDSSSTSFMTDDDHVGTLMAMIAPQLSCPATQTEVANVSHEEQSDYKEEEDDELLTPASEKLSHLCLTNAVAPMIVWIDSAIKEQRNILPSAMLRLLTVAVADGRGFDLCCIFMAWEENEFFQWVRKIKKFDGLNISSCLASYSIDKAPDEEKKHFNSIFILTICSKTETSLCTRISSALYHRQFSSMLDFAIALQNHRAADIASEDDVTHIIVATNEAASTPQSSILTKDMLREVVSASDKPLDTIDVIFIE